MHVADEPVVADRFVRHDAPAVEVRPDGLKTRLRMKTHLILYHRIAGPPRNREYRVRSACAIRRSPTVIFALLKLPAAPGEPREAKSHGAPIPKVTEPRTVSLHRTPQRLGLTPSPRSFARDAPRRGALLSSPPSASQADGRLGYPTAAEADTHQRQVRRGPSRRGDGGLDRVLIVPGICRHFAARGDGEGGLGLGPLVTTR